MGSLVPDALVRPFGQMYFFSYFERRRAAPTRALDTISSRKALAEM